MHSAFLVLGLLSLFFFKVLFKIFHFNGLLFLIAIFMIKYMENYLGSTSFGKWLKIFEKKIFNSGFFQSLLLLGLLLETFFFSPKELKLGVFDRSKVFFLRTLWLVLVWKGFCVISAEPLETFLDVISVFVFFSTLLYIDLRSKLLNYKFLELDTSFVSWSQIILKLQLLGEYQITNKVKDDFNFCLLSFSKFQNSSTKDLNPPTKRTMFTETMGKAFNNVFGYDNARKLFNALVASGVGGGLYVNYLEARKENIENVNELMKQLKPIQMEIDQYSKNAIELSIKIEELQMANSQSIFFRLFSPIFKQVPDYRALREIALYKFDLNITNTRLVRSHVEKEAITTAILYGQEARIFSIFRTPLNEHVYKVAELINVESLVYLFTVDEQKFFKVIHEINQKIIIERYTVEQLVSDSSIKPFLKLGSSDLTQESVSSLVTCSYEESFTTLFLYF